VYYEPTQKVFESARWDYTVKQKSADIVIDAIGGDSVAFTGTRQCPNKKGRPTLNWDACDKHSDCTGILDKEIKGHNPSVIIPIGFKATGAVLHAAFPHVISNTASGGTYIGHKIPSGKYNAWICPVISAIDGEDYRLSYSSGKENQQKDAVDMFISRHTQEMLPLIDKRPFPKAGFDPTPTLTDIDPTFVNPVRQGIEILNNPAKISAVLQHYCNISSFAAFDYECNALSTECPSAKALTASVAFGNKKHLTYAGAFVFSDKTYFEPWVEFLRHPIRKVGANIKFEETWSSAYFKQPVNNWHWDVGVAGHIQDSMPGVAGLKHMSLVSFGVGGYDNDIDKYITGKKGEVYGMNSMENCPKSSLLLYNAIDSIMTLKLMYKQKQELAITDTWDRLTLWQ
jgi:hypothetical protein